MRTLSKDEMKKVIGGVLPPPLCAGYHQNCSALQCCDPTHLCEDWPGSGKLCRTIFE